MIQRKYILKLTRRSFLGLTLIIILGAIWMFVLGIFVGRNSIPVRFHIKDIKEELALLKSEDQDKTKTEMNIAVSDKKEGLGFYEDLKENKSLQRTATKRTSPVEGNVKKAVPSAARGTVVKGSDTKKETVVKQAAGEKSLTIQVASVKDEATSTRMVAELKKQGYLAYKIKVTIPELGIWFRVRVGHYSSKDEARSDIDGLKKINFKPILLHE